jgi:hypothetical protein
MRRLVCAGVLSAAAVCAGAASLPDWFRPSLLWAGSYHGDEALANRADARLRLHFAASPWLDFSARAQFLDKRPSEDMFSDGASFFGAGFYHNYTGSRVLYGPLDIGGLPARIKNIYRRGTPYVAAHSRYTMDLKTDAGASSKNALGVRLVTPSLPGLLSNWQAQAAFTAEETDGRTGFLFGAETVVNSRVQAAAEFYYQKAVLPVNNASAWFSDKPPLPEREARLYAGSARVLSPFVSVAADLAYSETFAFGRGMYANLGLRFGNRPWRFSLAADTVTPRFVDSAGAVPGRGLRVGGKIEHFLPRGEVWRAETSLRGYGDGEDAFTRSSSALYYRFPSVKSAFSLSTVSLSASRNATSNAKILDSWHGAVGINAGRLRTKTSFTLEEYTHDDAPSPYPDRECSYVIHGWRLNEEASLPLGSLTLTAALGYHQKRDATTAQWKDAEIPFSLSAQFRRVPGRVTVKYASTGFPEDWSLSVSWRFSPRLSP